MSDADPPPEPAARGASTQDLEATVCFDLGETTTSLETLESLQPGFVFELSRRLPDAVAISVHGSPWGRGELVRVGERLAVRVVEVLPRGNDAS